MSGIHLCVAMTKHIIFKNVCTVCDICGQNVASQYFWREKDKMFREVLAKTRYSDDMRSSIEIVGVCDRCKGKLKLGTAK